MASHNPTRLGNWGAIFTSAALWLSFYALLLNEKMSTVTSSLVAAGVTCSPVPNEEAPPRNKTLVIVIGQTRAAAVTFDRFKKHVLEPLDADLALSVSSMLTPDLHGRDPYREAANYIWEYPEVDDWEEAYDYIQRVENTTGDWRQGLKVGGNVLWGGMKGFTGGAAVQFFFKWFTAKKLKELGLHYRRYIITRSDHFYEADHPVIDDKYIWVPEGEDWGGVCDRHMYLRHEEIFAALEMLHDMFHAEFASWMKTTKPYAENAERFLLNHLRKVGLVDQIRRFPRLMYLVREDKTPTRWSTGNSKQPGENGLWIKYEDEYYKTMRNLGRPTKLLTPEPATDRHR